MKLRRGMSLEDLDGTSFLFAVIDGDPKKNAAALDLLDRSRRGDSRQCCAISQNGNPGRGERADHIREAGCQGPSLPTQMITAA